MAPATQTRNKKVETPSSGTPAAALTSIRQLTRTPPLSNSKGPTAGTPLSSNGATPPTADAVQASNSNADHIAVFKESLLGALQELQKLHDTAVKSATKHVKVELNTINTIGTNLQKAYEAITQYAENSHYETIVPQPAVDRMSIMEADIREIKEAIKNMTAKPRT